jgi:hypothetical protein
MNNPLSRIDPDGFTDSGNRPRAPCNDCQGTLFGLPVTVRYGGALPRVDVNVHPVKDDLILHFNFVGK